MLSNKMYLLFRYFTRLDLCRHFVDFHLRPKLGNCLDANTNKCPACPLTYDKTQSRLRHFIWSHQDLDGLALSNSSMRLSEFMPTERDLEVVRIKNEMMQNPQAQIQMEYKNITDLAALPVYDNIDVKCATANCELCGEEFKTSANKSRDKANHLIGHFRQEVLKDLPIEKPYKCPKCAFIAKDLFELSRHHALNHKVVFIAMQKELGETSWTLGSIEENDCKICNQVFMTPRLLIDHYCTQHFYSRLSQGLSQTPPYNCSKCSFTSKTHMGMVRHLGNRHKMVKQILEESLEQPTNQVPIQRTMPTNQGKVYQGADNKSWVEHYMQPQKSTNQLPVVQQNQPAVLQQKPINVQQDGQLVEQQVQQVMQQVVQQRPGVVQQGQQVVQSIRQVVQSQPVQSQPVQSQLFDQEAEPPVQIVRQQIVQQPAQQLVQIAQPQQLPVQLSQVAEQQPINLVQQSVQPDQPLQLTAQQPEFVTPVVSQNFQGSQEQFNQAQPQNVSTQPQNQPKVTTTRSDQVPVACPICNSTFLNGTHFLRHAADKHFMDQLKIDMPKSPPWQCPFCDFNGKDLKLLVRHYGLTHKMVLKLLNERVGIMNSFDDAILKQYETCQENRDKCPLCVSTFGTRYMLLRHLADCHFKDKLIVNLPKGTEIYKCPECNHESKDKGSFARHLGLVHKKIQQWLKEMGIEGYDDNETGKKGSMIVKQDQQSSEQLYYQPEMPQNSSTEMQKQYYSSTSASAGAFSDQFSPRTNQNQGQQNQPPFSTNEIMSPGSSQTSPQNLSISADTNAPPAQQPTTSNYQYYAPSSNQPQDLSTNGNQPLDFSNNGFFNPPRQPTNQQSTQQFNQQQPLTPQTPNPSVTPQPMTPQPMTPRSQSTPTPQPMTPQDQSSTSSGLMSPGGYSFDAMTPNSFYAPQTEFNQNRPTEQTSTQGPSRSQPQTTSRVPAQDAYIKNPEPGVPGPYSVQCSLGTCSSIVRNKSDFYRHLSERHFKANLATELPSVAPFKCPMTGCQYESKDNSVTPLVKHYGIVHKAVQKYLNGQIAGRYVEPFLF